MIDRIDRILVVKLVIEGLDCVDILRGQMVTDIVNYYMCVVVKKEDRTKTV
jgi:hypothetical protein